MKWELFISWRYFMARRKERFISLISLISILGVALGVMALIVVISVMNGFDQELRQKIVGVNPHILITKEGGIENPGALLLNLKKTEHVEGASPFIAGQALFKAEDAVSGVLVRGIDSKAEAEVTNIEEYLIDGSLDLTDQDIIIGQELANKFRLKLGDKAVIVSPDKGREFNFRVSGIFNSGMYEYDLNLIIINIKSAQKIFNLNRIASGIGVRLDNLYRAKSVRNILQKDLGYPFLVRDWIAMNSNLFGALKLEKTAMFVIMALIVIVASFNIVGTLIMMVNTKTKDIGIFKALGAKDKAIRKIFTYQGLIIGMLGTSLGASTGILLCYLLKTYEFISLPADIYYIKSLPVQMRLLDSAVIITAALLISLLSTIYPAHQAARLTPAEGLRYE